MSMYSLLCCWKRAFAMTNVFPWWNYVSFLPCFILYLKAKLACYSRYLLTSYFCIPIPYDEKDIFFFFFFLVLVVEGLLGHYRTIQLQPLQHSWLLNPSGIDLDYCDTEWFALEMNWDHSVIFEIVSKYCILLTLRATPFLLKDSRPQ